jgi:hypothetical protein
MWKWLPAAVLSLENGGNWLVGTVKNLIQLCMATSDAVGNGRFDI